MAKGSQGLVGDERGGVERWVVWLVALAVVGGLAGSVVYLDDELRRDSPGADFSVSFESETGTLTVEHAGGDAISDRTTERLSVVVLDGSTGTNEELAWVSDSPGATKRGVGYPIRPGDSLTVDDPRVDADGDGSYLDAERSVGFYLEPGDSVRVVWTGSMRGTTQAVTLANATLE
ncbi:hypothetical protein C475_10704 [Halosimplex carlsbadense 2-9-1]|uniref:Archaeal Type IV pilin N-terminal domain-containing protein n=1 Tax=Halosimplex carlsbadense 2-9-1 TaxID=797114 RepID=M0CQI6_9EURY|nr:type IV pilin [Halosimplex carlsbadense]ELZ25495.1 hypothetical protein C475_10704 [Halosimplex carlsbadense 2-9-1]